MAVEDELEALWERRVAFHEDNGAAHNEAEFLATLDVYGGDVQDENGRPDPDIRILEAKRIAGDA